MSQTIMSHRAMTTINHHQQFLNKRYVETVRIMMETDRLMKIYPTKKGGEQWFIKSDPASDPRFSPQTTMTKNSDGSFKVKSTKVRMGVFTSSGFHPESI